VDAEVEQLRGATEHHREPAAPKQAPARQLDQGRDSFERFASGVGNRELGRMISRMSDGEGILEGGLVHPDVEAAISASRGGGRPLERAVRQHLEPSVGESLGDVRVHTGEGAAALARAVSARAFTVGSDIFFASGEYRPGSGGGNELIAHELAHVVQQRGAPQTGPLTVSQPGDSLEREAEAAARELTA